MSGDHFYTAAAREKDHLVSMGWIDEGTGWYSADALNGTPLYRSYNPNAQTGSHNYTQDAREYEFLAGQGLEERRHWLVWHFHGNSHAGLRRKRSNRA